MTKEDSQAAEVNDDKEMKERRRYASWMCDRMACGVARV